MTELKQMQEVLERSRKSLARSEAMQREIAAVWAKYGPNPSADDHFRAVAEVTAVMQRYQR